MGTRGPVPNRETDLARPRSRKGAEQSGPPVTKGELRKTTVPTADPEWHAISKMLWESLTQSGQADFYQQSDWAYAYSICEDLSLYKASGRRSAQMAQVIYSAMSNLLVTEADLPRVLDRLSGGDRAESETDPEPGTAEHAPL